MCRCSCQSLTKPQVASNTLSQSRGWDMLCVAGLTGRKDGQPKHHTAFTKYEPFGILPSMAYKDKDKQREAVRRHYEKNRVVMKQRAAIYNKAHRVVVRDYVLAYLKDHPCVDCGEVDPIVLEFDHVRDKVFNISQASGYGLDRIKEEIDKCEVRCANCHRQKTYRQLNYFGKG